MLYRTGDESFAGSMEAGKMQAYVEETSKKSPSKACVRLIVDDLNLILG